MSDPYWAFWWTCETGAFVLLLFSWFGPMRHAQQHSRAGRRFGREADTAAYRSDWAVARQQNDLAIHEYELAQPLHALARRLNYTAIAMTWSLLFVQLARAVV